MCKHYKGRFFKKQENEFHLPTKRPTVSNNPCIKFNFIWFFVNSFMYQAFGILNMKHEKTIESLIK